MRGDGFAGGAKPGWTQRALDHESVLEAQALDDHPTMETYTFPAATSSVIEDALHQGKMNELRAAFEKVAIDAQQEAANSPAWW